jgi:hypothetical protein
MFYLGLYRLHILALALVLATAVQLSASQSGPVLPATRLASFDLAGETWPGDFDEDGTTDLIGTQPDSGNLVVILGRSRQSIVTELQAAAIYVADFNRDALADVVALGPGAGGSERSLHVLRGNGDGTFEIAATLPPAYYTFAVSADFDGDGHRDVAVGAEPDSLHIFRGFGNFTFDPPVTYTTGAFPHGGIATDFTGDGRPDIAVAAAYGFQVDVFINGGNLLFAGSTLRTDRSATDATARDLNGDTNVDLIVSVRGGSPDGPFENGFVQIYFGNGDGTFEEPLSYETGIGAHAVVVGDFTRDGKLDIATANRSARYIDALCGGLTHGDSASILPGKGDGTFGHPTTFTLDSQRAPAGTVPLANTVLSLNTSDMNGDRQTDLIVSHGRVLVNLAPRANRRPKAFAGEDQFSLSGSVNLFGGGEDPDGHLLSFSWVHSGGLPVSGAPVTCAEGLAPGAQTFTLTADDGQGGRDSDDMLFTYASDEGLPVEWASGDIGQVGAAGSAYYGSGIYTVTGAGSNVGGSADGFYFANTTVTGNFDLVARLVSVQDVNRRVKAGVMIRETLAPGSRHAFAVATPRTERGLAFQRRVTTDGATTRTAGPAWNPPAWLKLSRRGDKITAFYRKDAGDAWTTLAAQTYKRLPATLFAGLAVSSHVDGKLATATFESVSVDLK